MFWENFARLCESAGKTPTGVSKELGFSNAAASHWKNGKSPTAKTLQKIADYFNVTVNDLLSGTRRVPIAQKTAAMWEKLRDERKTPDTRTADSRYKEFADRLNAKMAELGLPDHLPHDTRYTCATMMHRAKVDLLTRKRILGHAVTDITEGVYTDTADAELLAAIDSI